MLTSVALFHGPAALVRYQRRVQSVFLCTTLAGAVSRLWPASGAAGPTFTRQRSSHFQSGAPATLVCIVVFGYATHYNNCGANNSMDA